MRWFDFFRVLVLTNYTPSLNEETRHEKANWMCQWDEHSVHPVFTGVVVSSQIDLIFSHAFL
uniref:Uncharacterized protein n=1 Tax=Anguilla anguilla TaxID=7936 RepID=A0A0E9WR56_ANGAN